MLDEQAQQTFYEEGTFRDRFDENIPETGEQGSIWPAADHTEVGSNAALNDSADRTSGGGSGDDFGNEEFFISIADSVSEKDRVSFTIQTKLKSPYRGEQDFTVTRSHDDFVWLHEQFESSSSYAAIIIPPCPPKPNFEDSREKLLKLSVSEGNLTKAEEERMTNALKAEYLAKFKKTVAMHEVFLRRLGEHPLLRTSHNLHCFLEYNDDLGLKYKSRREKVVDFFHRSLTEPLTSALIQSHALDQMDNEEDLKRIRHELVAYNSALKQMTNKLDNVTKSRRNFAQQSMVVQMRLTSLADCEKSDSSLRKLLNVVCSLNEKLQNLELRIASDDDLKLTDTIRYYRDNSISALSLLNRRSGILKEYVQASKEVTRASDKNKCMIEAQKHEDDCREKYQKITGQARVELETFEATRVSYISQHLAEYVAINKKNNETMLILMKRSLANMQTP